MSMSLFSWANGSGARAAGSGTAHKEFLERVHELGDMVHDITQSILQLDLHLGLDPETGIQALLDATRFRDHTLRNPRLSDADRLEAALVALKNATLTLRYNVEHWPGPAAAAHGRGQPPLGLRLARKTELARRFVDELEHRRLRDAAGGTCSYRPNDDDDDDDDMPTTETDPSLAGFDDGAITAAAERLHAETAGYGVDHVFAGVAFPAHVGRVRAQLRRYADFDDFDGFDDDEDDDDEVERRLPHAAWCSLSDPLRGLVAEPTLSGRAGLEQLEGNFFRALKSDEMLALVCEAAEAREEEEEDDEDSDDDEDATESSVGSCAVDSDNENEDGRHVADGELDERVAGMAIVAEPSEDPIIVPGCILEGNELEKGGTGFVIGSPSSCSSTNEGGPDLSAEDSESPRALASPQVNTLSESFSNSMFGSVSTEKLARRASAAEVTEPRCSDPRPSSF